MPIKVSVICSVCQKEIQGHAVAVEVRPIKGFIDLAWWGAIREFHGPDFGGQVGEFFCLDCTSKIDKNRLNRWIASAAKLVKEFEDDEDDEDDEERANQ